MNESEKISFLSEKIQELNRISSEIESVFPEKSFKLDGILVGNIVEVMAAYMYGITLYRQSEKTHDGEVDGKKVQIKGTQGNNTIVIREQPEYLIVPSMNSYTLNVNKLLDLNQQVPDEKRIPAIVPVERLTKNTVTKREATNGKGRKTTGKTLIPGYVNKNQQENRGCLHKPGNYYIQTACNRQTEICSSDNQ